MDEVQLCNMALGRIKAQPITNLLTETSKQAATCRIFYEPLRDALLREYPWAFSVRRQVLALSTDENLTTYQYAYQLPTDPKCLGILEVLSEALIPSLYPYEEEGGLLFTNEPNAVIRYIGQIVDPNEFDPIFVDAFAWRLAAEMIDAITGKEPDRPWAMYTAIITKAWGADAQRKVESAVPSQRWTDERHGRRV